MPMPFFYGAPISPGQFLDRRREVRRIAGRILHQGQSTAIVGAPRMGKTSLLLYLSAPENRQTLYGADVDQMFFSFLDAQTLSSSYDQAMFWALAFRPLNERIIEDQPQSAIARAYLVCRDNGFGTFAVEQLLSQMAADKLKLVFLLDEFDTLMHHPVLNSAEFFGSLRSLASRSKGALALVIASRLRLEELNQETQEFSRTGSPYFNFLDEIILGPLPATDAAELLGRGDRYFTVSDRQFILEVSGAHPGLLQLSASALWNAYEDNDVKDGVKRLQAAGQRIYQEAGPIISDTWRIWPPAMRMAFTSVALAHIAQILGEKRFAIDRLIGNFPNLQSELSLLERQGFIVVDDDVPIGWRVLPGVFLWWLADEFTHTSFRDRSLDEWFVKQQWDGILTQGQKQQLERGVRGTLDALKGSSKTLIESAASILARGAKNH